MTALKDLALTGDQATGEVIAHRLDCPVVQLHRDAGLPILNLYDCQGTLPADLKRHACLDQEEVT